MLRDFDISKSKKEALGVILCGQELFDSMTPNEVSDFLKNEKSQWEILVLAATEIGPIPRLHFPRNFVEYAPSQFVFPLRLLKIVNQQNLNIQNIIDALENGAYQISPRVGQLLPYSFTKFGQFIELSSSVERVSEFKTIDDFLSPNVKVLGDRILWKNPEGQALPVVDLLISELKSRVLASSFSPIKKKLIFRFWKLIKIFL
jgi:hypothetical protein